MVRATLRGRERTDESIAQALKMKGVMIFRQVLECASPLALFECFAIPVVPKRRRAAAVQNASALVEA